MRAQRAAIIDYFRRLTMPFTLMRFHAIFAHFRRHAMSPPRRYDYATILPLPLPPLFHIFHFGCLPRAPLYRHATP
jgi:hypothetical protein